MSTCRPKNVKRRAGIWPGSVMPEPSATPPLGACRRPRHASVTRRAFVSLAADFERIAAPLSHPNIGSIHGLEHANLYSRRWRSGRVDRVIREGSELSRNADLQPPGLP